MKLLILDNGAKPLDGLRELCGKHEVTVADYETAAKALVESYDGLILAGGYVAVPVGDATDRRTDKDSLAVIVQQWDKPVLGVGYGFELLYQALGINLSDSAEKNAGAVKLIPTEAGAKLFQGTDPIRVNETLRWCFDEAPRGVAVLARSDSGIEAIQHKSRPVIALQLFPEDFTYASDAKLVYQNLLSVIAKD